MQVLVTAEQRQQLTANWRTNAQRRDDTVDCVPVVKLFTPWANATWLLTELDPMDGDTAFGLCDLGQGAPELGYVSLAEISDITGPAGLKIERDEWITFGEPLSKYHERACEAGRIVA